MKAEEEARKIVEDLKQRGLDDAVYRILWFEHVLEDVTAYMTEEAGYEGPPLKGQDKGTAEIVASRYVYEGDYDCNQSYWNNIDNLLGEVEREQER